MSSMSIVPTALSGETGKIVSAHEAVRLIHDGDTVASGGFAGIGFAEEIAIEIEKAFLRMEASGALLRGQFTDAASRAGRPQPHEPCSE